MANMNGYTSKDLYSEDKLHDIVQKVQNCIMHLKGLNPSITEDVASLQMLEYEVYFKSLERCTDEFSMKVKEMVE
eukprot:6983479-Ditylum_brightwellii.AAC.1